MATEGALDWEALLGRVRAAHPDLYRAWFDELSCGQIAGGELVIEVGDAARAHHLRDFCTRPFSEAVTALCGHLVAVRFASPNEVAHGSIRPEDEGLALSATSLSPDYTFDEFVVGASNRLAHAACRAVCMQAGTLYNPLFIHGGSGLGKSHLLQAACAEAERLRPGLRVKYLSGTTFVGDLVRALGTGGLQRFRAEAREVELLVLDDVQFLASQDSSQEELFHAFNALYQARRQIILSADCAPGAIPALEERLVSRFNWGLVTSIAPPSRETRLAILQKKARLRGWQVSDEVLDVVAELVPSNIREVEGALTKLVAQAQLTGVELTRQQARELLGGAGVRPGRPLTAGEILVETAKHFAVRPAELASPKRTRALTRARQTAMYLTRQLTTLSLEEIGQHYGGRDHSTVLHAERVIGAARQVDPAVAEAVARLTRRLVDGGAG